MLKLLGLMTVFLSASLFGLTYAEKERKAAFVYAELVDYFTFLEKEIRRKRTVDSITADFFSGNKNSYLEAASREELITALKNESIFDTKYSLMTECAEFLERLGKNVNCESECASCLSFLEHVRETEIVNRKENEHRREMFTKLGILAGMALCIIVW